jgi:hypothetical protein
VLTNLGYFLLENEGHGCNIEKNCSNFPRLKKSAKNKKKQNFSVKMREISKKPQKSPKISPPQ